MNPALTVFFLILLSGCTSYKFAVNGVKAEQVDQYVNVEEDIQVWLYLDYDGDVVRNGGVQVNQLYEGDLPILKAVRLTKRSNKILFSVKSIRQPAHHLIAVKHEKRRLDTLDYERTTHNGSFYYRKDFKLADIQIRHAVIPYGDKSALSLVYYAKDEDKNRFPFRRLDYLAGINAHYLQNQKEQRPYWQVNACGPTLRIDYTLQLDGEILRNNRFSTISLIAWDEVNPSMTYFKVLTSDDRSLALNLCPGTYLVKYTDLHGDVLKTDTVDVSR